MGRRDIFLSPDVIAAQSTGHGPSDAPYGPLCSTALAETTKNRCPGYPDDAPALLSYSIRGTRVGGFVLTRQEAAGKWGAATYSLSARERGTA